MICLCCTHSNFVGRVHQVAIYVQIVVSSDCGVPPESDLHAFFHDFRFDEGKAIDMNEFNVERSAIVDRIMVGITKLNIVDSWLSCSGQIFFAFIVDDIDEIFDILGLCYFLFKDLRGCNLTRFFELSVIVLFVSFFYWNCLLFEGLQLDKFSAVKVHLAFGTKQDRCGFDRWV